MDGDCSFLPWQRWPASVSPVAACWRSVFCIKPHNFIDRFKTAQQCIPAFIQSVNIKNDKPLNPLLNLHFLFLTTHTAVLHLPV